MTEYIYCWSCGRLHRLGDGWEAITCPNCHATIHHPADGDKPPNSASTATGLRPDDAARGEQISGVTADGGKPLPPCA